MADTIDLRGTTPRTTEQGPPPRVVSRWVPPDPVDGGSNTHPTVRSATMRIVPGSRPGFVNGKFSPEKWKADVSETFSAELVICDTCEFRPADIWKDKCPKIPDNCVCGGKIIVFAMQHRRCPKWEGRPFPE